MLNLVLSVKNDEQPKLSYTALANESMARQTALDLLEVHEVIESGISYERIREMWRDGKPVELIGASVLFSPRKTS